MKANITVEGKVITKTIREDYILDCPTTVYNEKGQEFVSYNRKTSKFTVTDRFVPQITMEASDFETAKKIDSFFYSLRGYVANSRKASGLVCTSTGKRMVLLFNTSVGSVAIATLDEEPAIITFPSRTTAMAHFSNATHELKFCRWLTFNKKRSTNNKMLNVTDWLLKK